MSQENVEIVRRFLASFDGEDTIPRVREIVELLGPDFQPDAVLAYWADDPALKYLHPDIEWDTGAWGSVVRGPRELSLWMADYLGAWESFAQRWLEYRDLGDWVLVRRDTRACGREGIAVEMRSFVLYQVRDGRVAVRRTFRTEQEALKAVGLAE